jgi:murein DD-endopeptidase MepM/ murein hydrolase activator NlpD
VMALLPIVGALLTSASLAPSAAATTLDIPADVLGALESAGRLSGIPWALLAGIGSVATDFGRHAPDGQPRDEGAIFPVVSPPITGHGAGDGMFLVDPAGQSVDLQDVAIEASLLAGLIGAQASERSWPPTVGLPEAALSDPAVAAFWHGVVASLPLRIPGPADTGSTDLAAPAPPAAGRNPIEQFGQGLLTALGDEATSQALGAIAAWAAGEGSCAQYNPLDTTQPEAGATPFNTLAGGGHVWNYPSWSEGIQATVETLRNGLYPTILTVLAAGGNAVSLEAAVRASPWGTGRFGSTSFSGAHCPGASQGPAAPVSMGSTDLPALIVTRAAAYQVAVAVAAPSAPAQGGPPTATALAGIPHAWLVATMTAADRFAVPWTLVAALLQQTCDFGRSESPGCQPPVDQESIGRASGAGAGRAVATLAPEPAGGGGARGGGASGGGAGGAGASGRGGQGYALLTPEQWRTGLAPDRPIPRDGVPSPPGAGYATDGDGDGRADPWSIADASASCARRLADLGADDPSTLDRATFAYLYGPAVPFDPADALTTQVLARSASYGGVVAASDGYTLPVDQAWYDQHPDWFERPHHDYPAVDIPVPAGTPVYAVTSSTVIAADEAGGTTDCGHDVRLRDLAGTIYTYCHGSEVFVSVGQQVATGQLILRSGWSGHVAPAGPAGAHLHFQINLPGHASSSCPQPALAAWAIGESIDLQTLPTTGCVSGGSA